MVEISSSGDVDKRLLLELRVHVENLAPSLPRTDASLAHALATLLSHFDSLRTLCASPETVGILQSQTWGLADLPPADGNMYSTLRRQVSNLQLKRSASASASALLSGTPPVLAVQRSLLWSRIDEELESIVHQCKERAERMSIVPDYLPPQYESSGYPHTYDLSVERDDFDDLPEYDDDECLSFESAKSKKASRTESIEQMRLDEKMRLDFEAITLAIDRLYIVAPQLHNQRVELKSSKLAQLQRAAEAGPSKAPMERAATEPRLWSSSKGKQKEKLADVQDLDRILQLVSKASELSYSDQSFVRKTDWHARDERRYMEKQAAQRQAFVEHLIQHSDSGRFHGQDASPSPRATEKMREAQMSIRGGELIRDPDTLLTLPEFIREKMPANILRQDPQALLSLPEFMQETVPSRTARAESLPLESLSRTPSTASRLRPSKSIQNLKMRTRSMSAPSINWLRSRGRSGSGDTLTKATSGHAEAEKADGISSFELTYVAEHHENLQHVLVFFSTSGLTQDADLEAEVIPGVDSDVTTRTTDLADRLIIRRGAQVTLPLGLPARVSPGKKNIKVQPNCCEIKLPSFNHNASESELPPLLDASQLARAAPTSFICASCSLPLVHCGGGLEYRDLPSEHWEELVDAWMCHPDQKLHEQVARHGRQGFWPDRQTALVGGSYILFEASVASKNNLAHVPSLSFSYVLLFCCLMSDVDGLEQQTDEWCMVRCICGSIVGRSRDRPRTDTHAGEPVFRLFKYAIRPVSPTSDPIRIPLSAYIVEDMVELAQAHASYRFIVHDEEEERPRILATDVLFFLKMWLFKPDMRMSYETSQVYAIPKRASMRAAKILFKLLGPAEASVDARETSARYPGFSQAEYLYYPMRVCQSLAALLKESSMTYPKNMRTMTGLDVGWLLRARI
ncbi:hypothetical protein FISHEDRAFT_45130 [Fistulina hepatica ATCC 64428]|uniref:HECT-like ubiquitin-conjugating enzyme-binding-domain-containing protein n=1 Tax=Fistulina hepatica ATCC 64428 TaxID=1128425 RepID=A0A0D7A9M4_9AGAR|nr:hypothetical protein FISHEDRAFT_45130 [Fistulina hepatica ATCC 64428]